MNALMSMFLMLLTLIFPCILITLYLTIWGRDKGLIVLINDVLLFGE